jgi:UDP-N-acetylmuramoyl-L-alanyl-D-glutamate--2,6-diaminopimelate ligase
MIPRPPLPQAPVLVAGLGRAGEAALELLAGAIGVSGLSAWDSSDGKGVKAKAARWRARGVRVALGGDGRDSLRSAGVCATIVKSPGIDMDTPLMLAAAEQGYAVIDELELGWRALERPVFAVAGTNGKSTTCALIASILRAAGQPAQLVGNTEFGPPLSGARPDAAVVCEVSSFQLEASPSFLPDIALFTNLSPEHLPRHGSMEAYGDVKQRMFVRGDRTSGVSVVNIDDERGRRILASVLAAGGKAIAYGFSSDADVRIEDARWTMREAHTLVRANGRLLSLTSRLPGRHNGLNIAAACAFGQAAGLGLDSIVAGVRDAKAPAGRWQLIDEGQPFDVVVDYAHTPDGLFQFLSAVRAVTSERGSALRAVFGAVGLPDPPKARGCAEAARALSDQLVLTTGSAPRSPRILRLRELRDAARSMGPVEIRLERRDAIAHAIASARPGDVVAILGLGALQRMALDAAGAAWPNDDRQTARTLLRSLPSCASS